MAKTTNSISLLLPSESRDLWLIYHVPQYIFLLNLSIRTVIPCKTPISRQLICIYASRCCLATNLTAFAGSGPCSSALRE